MSNELLLFSLRRRSLAFTLTSVCVWLLLTGWFRFWLVPQTTSSWVRALYPIALDNKLLCGIKPLYQMLLSSYLLNPDISQLNKILFFDNPSQFNRLQYYSVVVDIIFINSTGFWVINFWYFFTLNIIRYTG